MISMNLDTFIGDKTGFSFEHRILNTVILLGLVTTAVTTIFNYLLYKRAIISGLSTVIFIILGLIYYLSVVKKQYRLAVVSLIFIFAFIITPVIWIYNGGLLSGVTFYVLLFSSATAILLRGIHRIVTIGSLVTITSVLIIMEYIHPSLTSGYISNFERYIDMSVGFLIALIANTSLLIIIINRYIDEHRRANLYFAKIQQQKINSLHEQFSQVFNTSPALMAICRKRDLVYTAVNDAWLECLGFQRSEVLGRSELELNTLVPVNSKPFANVLLELGELEEFRVRTKHGEFRDWLMSKALLQINGQECILFASLDRTMLKQLENEISRLDRLNLVGEMAAGIGHEIRNPLTTVRGFLQLFQTQKEYSRNSQNIGVMIEELDRANSIITEFLSLAKNRIINLRPNNLNPIIDELYPLIKASAILEDKEVILHLDTNLPDVLADENEIRQLILNLTQNAREAISRNGKIIISTCTCREGQQAILTIKDNGPGFPPEIYEKLGTPFFTTKENGTGLGLAVCYRIADRHKAEIKIDTGPDGTEFSIIFPVVPTA